MTEVRSFLTNKWQSGNGTNWASLENGLSEGKESVDGNVLSQNWMDLKLQGPILSVSFSTKHPSQSVNPMKIQHPEQEIRWNCPFHGIGSASLDFLEIFLSTTQRVPTMTRFSGGPGWSAWTCQAAAGRRRHRWWLHLEGPGPREWEWLFELTCGSCMTFSIILLYINIIMCVYIYFI